MTSAGYIMQISRFDKDKFLGVKLYFPSSQERPGWELWTKTYISQEPRIFNETLCLFFIRSCCLIEAYIDQIVIEVYHYDFSFVKFVRNRIMEKLSALKD